MVKNTGNLGLRIKSRRRPDSELLDLLASDGMLIKRPLMSDGEKVTVGFKEEEYEKVAVNLVFKSIILIEFREYTIGGIVNECTERIALF